MAFLTPLMRLSLLLPLGVGFLCGRFVAAAKNPFFTPDGVPQTTVYPQVKAPTSPAIQSCFPLSTKLDFLEGLLRPWNGVHQYSLRQVTSAFENARLEFAPDNRYLASVAANVPMLARNDPNSVCESRKMLVNPNLSYSAAFCECSRERSSEQTCEALKEYVLSAMCPSEYTSKKGVDCEAITRRLDTFEDIAERCSGPLGGSTSALDLYLKNFLFFAGSTTPSEIDIDDPILETEGATYYLAWMATERMALFGDAYRNCGKQDVSLLPQWKTVLHINAAQAGEPSVVPAVIVAQSKESFLVVVRDMQTTFEGRLFAQTEMGFRYLSHITEPVQEGLASAAAALLPSLDTLFHDYFTTQLKTLVHPRILVVGAGGYGGGLAAFMANYIAKKWDSPDRPWADLLTVDSVIFSGPHVGSTSFASNYRKSVNARHISSLHSISGMMPCPTTMVCDTAHSAFAVSNVHHMGDVDDYSSLGGAIWIDSHSLAYKRSLQSFFNHGTNPFANRLALVVHTVCAPKCWITLRFCPNSPDAMCDKDSCPAMA